MKRYLILLILFFLYVQTQAQTIWSSGNGPHGGVINDIVTGAGSTVIAATQHNGIWRTATPSGDIWEKASGTDVAIHDLDVAPDGTIYASVSGTNRLLRSTNNGLDFSPAPGLVGLPNSAVGATSMVEVLFNNTIIYIVNASSTNAQIYRSTDSGATFSFVRNLSTSVVDLEVFGGSLVLTLGNGQLWLYNTENSSPFIITPPFAPLDVAIYGNDFTVLTAAGPYRSTDLGTTWTSIYNNLPPSNTFAGGVKYTPNGELLIFNTHLNVNALARSTDNGASWTYGNSFNGLPLYPSYKCVVFQSNSVAFMGTNGTGVMKSTSLPWVSWVHSSSQIKALQPTDIALLNTNVFTASGTKGVYINPTSLANGSFAMVDIPVRNLVTFNNAVFGYTPGAPGAVSSNGGSWTTLYPSTTFNNLFTIGSTLYDISTTTLQTNAGPNWTSAALTGTGIIGTITRVEPDATNNVYVLTTSNLYSVNVSTRNVTQLSLTGVLDIAFADGTLFALTTTTQIQRSTNGGSSFTLQSIPSTFTSNRIWAFDRNNFITRSLTNLSAAHTFNQNKLPQWSTRALNDAGTGVALVDFVYSTAAVGYAAVNNSVLHASTIPLASPKSPENLRIRTNSPSTPTFTFPQSGAFEFVFEDNDPVANRFVLERSLNNVAWDSVANATHASGATFKNYVGLADFNYANLTQGTQYYYRVKAVNESGTSAYSNVVSDVLRTYCVSTIPSGRSWNAVATADPGFTPNGAGPFTATNLAIYSTSNDRLQIPQYRFNIVPPSVAPSSLLPMNIQENCGQVNGFLTNFTSSSSNLWAFGRSGSTWNNVTKTLTVKWATYTFFPFEATTVFALNSQDPPPIEPTLTAGVYSGTEAILTWNFVDFATEYVLERSVNGANNFTTVATLGSNIQLYIDKGLTALTTYDYRIKARHNFGPNGDEVTNSFVNGSTPTVSFATVQLANSLYRPIETDLNLNLDSQQGASWADLDGDGDEDLLLATFTTAAGTQNAPISIFENTGNSQMKRKEVVGVTDDAAGASRAIGIMDFNNDGRLDLYVQWSQGGNDRIFVNQGNWSFTRILVNEVTNPVNGTVRENLAMSDVDKDSFIDFYLATEESAAPAPNTLIKNVSGTSVTQVANDVIATNAIRSRMAAFADYDNDGDQDLYASNDFGQGHLYNNNNGVFTRVTGLVFDTDNLTFVRTISWGDIDNDGDLDLYISGEGPSPTPSRRLYRNDFVNGAFSQFTPVSASILQTTFTGFSSAFGDLDNDGDLDLFATSPNTIFRNNGIGTFSVESSAELINNPVLQNGGVALADVDKDGFLEVFPSKSQSTSTLPNLLFKPTYAATSARRWLEVKLIGTASNKAAIGARVTVTTAATTSPAQIARTQIREVAGMTGYGSQNSLIQHFGLQNSTSCTVTVRWPSGIIQTLTGVASNQFITITEDNAGPAFATLSPAHDSKAVALNSALEITFDEAPVRVAGKKLSLFVASNLTTAVQVFDVTAGVLVGNKITFTPSAALTPNTLYKVVIEDGAFRDIYNNTSNYSTFNWQFTSLDIVAPVFGTPPATFPAQVSKGFSTSTFTASVSDNVSVASVTLSHRGAGTTDAFTDLSGTLNATTNLWEFIVPETLYSTTGLEFFFTAKDPDNNSTRHPTANNLQSLFETTPPVVNIIAAPATIAKGFGQQTFSVTATDNFSIASVKMNYRNTVNGVNYIEVVGTLDATIANRYNFTVPEDALNGRGIEYFFTAADPTGNSVRAPAGTATVTFLFETTPPVITVPANPATIAKGFTNRTYTVTATDNFGVASVSMSYRNTKNGTTYTTVTGTAGANNQYSFTVPETAFANDGLEFFYTAADATGNSVRNPLLTATPATFRMLLDNTSPVVGPFTPQASLPRANATFTVRVADNLDIATVVMRYRGITARNFTTVSGTRNTSGDYDFAVSQNWFDDMGIEYYFRATDASRNIGVSPDTTAATNKYHKTFLRFEGANLPKLTLIKGSTGASGYQIISVPLELTNKNIADNFEELGTADKTAYRFLKYRATPSPGWDEYPGGGLSVLARGEGYFLNSLNAEEITLLSGTAPVLDQTNFFQLALKKGWNQIGNPYTSQIQWSDVLAFNNNPAGVGRLVKYDNGYNTNDQLGILEPYRGGFVQVENDVTVRIPFRGFTTGGRAEVITAALDANNWQVPFSITQGDVQYQAGMIGMNEEASLSKDNFDLPILPRLSEYVEASFDHPEHFMKKFAQDVVPTQGEFTWSFQVHSNAKGAAVMAWDNTSFGNNQKELYLMDELNQTMVNMREVSSYTFSPKASHAFKIYFGEDLKNKIKPNRLTLSAAYPNPVATTTQLSFSVPESSSANILVALEVFDVMGRKVATLAEGMLAPGFYGARWDASLEAEGIYICRLTAKGNANVETVTEKIMVKK